MKILSKKSIIIVSIIVVIGGSAGIGAVMGIKSTPVETPKASVKKEVQKETTKVEEVKPVEEVEVTVVEAPKPVENVVDTQPVADPLQEIFARHGWDNLAYPKEMLNKFDIVNPGKFSGANTERGIIFANATGRWSLGVDSTVKGAYAVSFERSLFRMPIEKIEEVTGIKY